MIANRLAELGAKVKAQEQQKQQSQAEQTRALLEKGELLEFAEDMRGMFDAKLTYARVGDVLIGREPERGYGDFFTQSDIDRTQRKR